jgi:hypothetical protein
MHPPPLPKATPGLSYRLRKQFKSFRTEVSLNDGPMSSETPCTFWVYGDGKVLWKSTAVSSRKDTQRCAVSVQGVDVLRIAVTCPGPARGAHAVWLEPQVIADN